MTREYFQKRAKEYSERPEEQMGYLCQYDESMNPTNCLGYQAKAR